MVRRGRSTGGAGITQRISREIVPSLRGNTIRVLLYHGINDDPRDPYSLPLPVFEAQMEALGGSGVTVVSGFDVLLGINRLPQRHPQVCLTFDDGFDDFASAAFPTLRRHKFSAALFVSTALVGTTDRWPNWSANRRFVGWSELRELAQSGIAVGSHAATHRRLSTLDTEGLTDEMTSSREALRSRLPTWLDAIAYPFGDQAADVRAAAARAGYQAGFVVGGLWGNGLGIDRYQLRRRLITREVDPQRVVRIARGLDDWIQVLRGVFGLPGHRPRAPTIPYPESVRTAD